jgi:hypothetical protein
LLIAAHYLAGLKYPELRTGLYFIPIITLILLLARRDANPSRLGQAAIAIPLVVTLAMYLLQFDVRRYTEWDFDADTEQIAKMLREHNAVHVGASWELEPTLNYYRDHFRITSMEPVTRRDPDGDFDYFVLLPGNQEIISKRNLTVLYRGPISGAVLASRR